MSTTVAKPTKPELPETVLEFFRKQGKKGGLKLKREKPADYYVKIGKKGGRPPKKKKG